MAESDMEVPAALRGLADDARVTVRRGGAPDPNGKCVVYWMERGQRGCDNHALDLAVAVANALGQPLVVHFAGAVGLAGANLRQAVFLQRGLVDVEEDLTARNIAFVLRGGPGVGVVETVERLLADVGAAIWVGDENPLREPEGWRRELAARVGIPFWTVDADVVVPSKLMERAQYGAYTIRPRLYRMLPEFLVRFENAKADKAWKRPKGFYADSVGEDMTRGWKGLDRSVRPVEDWTGGSHAGLRRLRHFTEMLLKSYERDRNRPEVDGTSALSPYLRFGQVGPVTIALAVDAAAKRDASLKAARDGFFNELIAWRELAVNFVKYQAEYDSAECAEDWAKKTIADHARDERERLYSLKELEAGETYDALWNAAQTQMVVRGWMHNVMRMYWAKKILEWTPDVGTAVRWAIYLNDKYELDGRDANGYAGIAWSMVGKFDRAWGERPVFGKIRYMSGASTGRKFDSKLYIEQMQALRGEGFRLR
jgi:deoxyribodipyrimidine photo-lyase